MDILKDADIDPAPLAGKRVAIIGYGNQGRARRSTSMTAASTSSSGCAAALAA